MMCAPAPSLERALGLFCAVRDIIAERVEGSEPPRWAVVRGWDHFLLGLGPAELARLETLGLPAEVDRFPSMPSDLRALGREVRRLTDVELLDAAGEPPFRGSLRQVSASKRRQLDGVLRLCAPLVRRAERVVDVGSGHGHLARWVAEGFGVPVLGLERVPERVAAARRLAAGQESLEFGLADLAADQLELGPGDVAIGLHACGELGDTMIRAAAAAGCDAVLVSCCFQKIRGAAREPLSAPARQAAMVLAHEHLGLANLTVRAQGVAGTLGDTLAARRRRLALRLLLRERGLAVEQGEEMRGLNRRRAYGELERMASDALAARGEPPLRAGELPSAVAAGDVAFERIRRLSLPRNMLSRLLEVSIALDRARFLEEHGYAVRVVRPFDEEASPRNIAVVATAR